MAKDPESAVESTDPCCIPTAKNFTNLLSMLGYLAILFGVIQAGLGGGAFQYMSNIKFGAWWAGIMVIISGFLAIFCSTKGWTVATCVVSFVTMVITVVGATLDGQSSVLFRNIESCANGPSQELSANITTFGGSGDFLMRLSHVYGLVILLIQVVVTASIAKQHAFKDFKYHRLLKPLIKVVEI
eukprot:CAMPEP_0119042422 /NCGR_PEP_ID=MMETSP1177-20130426/15135_1 /TAXON_ID=2985 /ORGANISM="Ochromonas sp, Strain CCMP1899" /LENGTH=184 /DNA_ID=CAMNT_0007009213 /DNA_START=127 /DNA_END=682 /DNA_ORIENTATION=-